jgi:HTH-type transcriptional regulator, sugar sensing transcriptional regulator
MDDAVMGLMRLGFSAYEAKTYLALLQKSPAIGYEVSKAARIPTAKVYETLMGLVRKGFVLVSASEPIRYVPVAPEALTDRLRAEFDGRLEALDELLNSVPPLPEVDIAWNLPDYKAVLQKIAEVADRAEHDLMVSLWPCEAEAARAHLKAAEERGVRVIAAVFGDCDVGVRRAINLDSCGESSERRLGSRLYAAVGDDREVVVAENSKSGTRGVWATTPCIVLTAREYIKHDIWGKALIDALGHERFDEICRNDELLSYLIHSR